MPRSVFPLANDLTFNRRQSLIGLVGAMSTGLPASAKEDRPVIRPQDFGPCGDLVADSTQALQAAIDAAADSKAILSIPAQTYRISHPLRLRSGLTMQGVRAQHSPTIRCNASFLVRYALFGAGIALLNIDMLSLVGIADKDIMLCALLTVSPHQNDDLG